ncbi:hypothetical protein AAF712_008854 [Marasmius tenuissimus]|uniref:Uncharacterized protein n=1 Tax=Marasmius tenuissimus TaxID=585030 RepID=A0ABR2ZTU2_9AGAR|nr:hypothetical protein PM082_018013 [Marasmius tenuissimus]
MSNKTESTTSLIPKDSKDSKSSSSSKKDTSSSDAGKSSSSSTGANKVPTSMSDFAQKAKDQGWAAPTPTKPKLDGL